ncbi:hypothetical protein [Neisseria sp. S1]|uniref:hypothetical protein n=1 Tax=Neisseria sp. S1 TaxID=3318354 RepID=UPI003A89225D
MDYIRNAYKMPFLQPGTQVEYLGRHGVITGSKGGYILVDFGDGQPTAQHPEYNVAYFVDSELVKDFRQAD